MNEQEIRERYMAFTQLQEKIEHISSQLEQLGEHLSELSLSRSALEQLKSTQKGTEILAPIANGIFIKAHLAESDSLVVNVGSGVTVERDVAHVKELLGKQQERLTTQLEQGQNVLAQLQERAMQIYRDVEAAQQQAE